MYNIVNIVRNPKAYMLSAWNKLLESRFGMYAYQLIVLPWLVLKVSHSKEINVVFLAMNVAMWRYDSVYRRMLKYKRFNPIVVTAMNPSFALNVSEQDQMFNWFAGRGYKVIRGYDFSKNKWISLENLHPDIIFYTQPYRGMVAENFNWKHNLGKLLCYAPYSYQMSNAEWSWNNLLQNYCWRHFMICDYHRQLCKRASSIRAMNTAVVGYCLDEEFISSDNSGRADAAWRNDKRKRIIWAPHHSISSDEWFRTSSFLDIADVMVEIRNKYCDQVIFAFKPHPELYPKLLNIWGEEKAKRYFDDWKNSDNSFLCTGDYVDLFAGSDAMIHCSGSFIVEYLYTMKPVQYVYAKTRKLPDIGEVGDAALNSHYPAHSEKEIEAFIDNVVIAGNDDRAALRTQVAEKYLRSSDGEYFSSNVMNDLLKRLKINE